MVISIIYPGFSNIPCHSKLNGKIFKNWPISRVYEIWTILFSILDPKKWVNSWKIKFLILLSDFRILRKTWIHFKSAFNSLIKCNRYYLTVGQRIFLSNFEKIKGLETWVKFLDQIMFISPVADEYILKRKRISSKSSMVFQLSTIWSFEYWTPRKASSSWQTKF